MRWSAWLTVLGATALWGVAGCERETPSPPPGTTVVPPVLPPTGQPRAAAPADAALRFDEAFAGARPTAPPGWQPEVGSQVLARFVDVSWYEATVLETHPQKRKARLRWTAGTGGDRDVPLVDLAPLSTGVEAPGFALARPEGDGAWRPVEVLRLMGNDAEVVDREGRRRRLARAALVPVGRPPRSPR